MKETLPHSIKWQSIRNEKRTFFLALEWRERGGGGGRVDNLTHSRASEGFYLSLLIARLNLIIYEGVVCGVKMRKKGNFLRTELQKKNH